MVFSRSLASAALLSAAQALYLNSDLSFGQTNKVSTDLRTIPNFELQGKPDLPQVLSNKVILTPPAPGNQRGSIWADKSLDFLSWTIDFDFRTTGPERGSGNIQLWYAQNGKQDIGTSSVYTVGKFDGLALVIDQYAGSAGFIRGFLNDGSTDYKSHHSVDSLAFGHCEYSYRNLGRPSRIAVRQSQDNFRVDVDGHLCFESSKIRLPTGYQLGVTAASAENADSFEVFKFVVTTDNMTPDTPSFNSNSNSNTKKDNIPANNAWGGSSSSSTDPSADEPASAIPVDAQFADLHNRLQSMMKHISALNRDVSASQSNSLTRYSSLEDKISHLERQMNKLDSLSTIDKKLNEIQADVRQTKADLHSSLDRQVAGLKSVVRDTHRTMLGRLPGIMGYVMVVVAGQALTIVGYLVYKKRKNGGLKKYI